MRRSFILHHCLSAYITRDLYNSSIPCTFDPRALSAKRNDTASSTACANWWEDWTKDSPASTSCFDSVCPVAHPPHLPVHIKRFPLFGKTNLLPPTLMSQPTPRP